jgi:hypothetical protein
MSESDSHTPSNEDAGGKRNRSGLAPAFGVVRAFPPATVPGALGARGILRIEFCAQAKVEWSTVRLLALTRRRLVSDFSLVERSNPKCRKYVLGGHPKFKQLWNQCPNLHPEARCLLSSGRMLGRPSPFVDALSSATPAFGNQTLLLAIHMAPAPRPSHRAL